MKTVKRKSIGTHFSMCVQPAFIIGTNNEDGTHNFAPITWVSVTSEKDNRYASCQNLLNIFEIFGKINFPLPFFGGKPFFNHVLQKRFQTIIVAIQVIENAWSVQVF